jgi:hypothetical protein
MILPLRAAAFSHGTQMPFSRRASCRLTPSHATCEAQTGVRENDV